MLPQSFGRISTAGSTVRGLVSHAFFSTRDGSDMVVMIDGEKTFNDVVVRAGCGVRHPPKNHAGSSCCWSGDAVSGLVCAPSLLAAASAAVMSRLCSALSACAGSGRRHRGTACAVATRARGGPRRGGNFPSLLCAALPLACGVAS